MLIDAQQSKNKKKSYKAPKSDSNKNTLRIRNAQHTECRVQVELVTAKIKLYS